MALRSADAEQMQGYYRIANIYEIQNINVASLEKSGAGVGGDLAIQCDYIDSGEDAFIEHGDIVGFVCSERVRIVFTNLLHSQMNGGTSLLKLHNISAEQSNTDGNLRSSLLQVGSLVSANQFESLNQSMTPLLRAIMSKKRTKKLRFSL